MAEINCQLANIKNVKVSSKVVQVGEDDPKVVTQVSFQYDGEPSEVEGILMAEAHNVKVHASLYSEQQVMDLEPALN